MTQPPDDALVAIRKILGITDDDNFVMAGDDLQWLMRQLGQWPTRVHPDCTTNIRFLMQTAAVTLHTAATALEAKDQRIAELRQALEDVCNPLRYFQRMAEAEGARLSGMAYTIANDIATVQRIARATLEPAKGEGR